MSVITFRNSIEKNKLVWVGPTPSAIFLTQEALLWKDGLLFVGKDSFLVTVLFYNCWLYCHSDDSALGIIMLYFNQKISFILFRGPKDVKDIFASLKDSVGDISGSADIVKNQITFSLLFSLIISLISDAPSASPDEMSILSRDASFRRNFHETVMAIGNDQIIEGCMHCVRLAWAVHLMILQNVTDASGINNDVRNINSCLKVVFSNNVFHFLIDKALRTPAYQVLFFC
ncbi:putative nucleoporin [Helianthus anomalus]